MQVTPQALPELLLIEPRVFADERGFFMESFNQREFDRALGSHVEFVQDNHSRSRRGVLRGLHYQLLPHGQGKLVRVTQGRVFDVAVDVRRSSPRFGRWVGVELSGDNHRQLWIPPGFAHGFLVLSDSADFAYKTTEYWFAESDRAIRWDDADIAIGWPALDAEFIVGAKDSAAPALAQAEVYP
ncbi:MAG: dTDP-4-dehydrorhamnose 3,5-epimerase [Burkholderiaceae bacterium]